MSGAPDERVPESPGRVRENGVVRAGRGLRPGVREGVDCGI